VVRPDVPFPHCSKPMCCTINWIDSRPEGRGPGVLNFSMGCSRRSPLATLARNRAARRLLAETSLGKDIALAEAEGAKDIGYMSQRLRRRGLAARFIPGLADDVPFANTHSSAVGFKLYAPEAREWLNLERSVSAVNDYGKWTFEATGSVQPFEKPDRYQARAVKNRFTPEMLEEYCSALGIRLFDGEFYGPAGNLVKIGDPLPPEFVAISLAEAQSRLGIRSQ